MGAKRNLKKQIDSLDKMYDNIDEKSIAVCPDR